ncbi:MAG: CPBP family intramembrane metalloprotease [Clostridiaceae bacterium]|jgi:membrane protease YdiL (CAAX protease family)|nr:CPBP family intramembrane metalloprotease [Clostridiaceae bacterium]
MLSVFKERPSIVLEAQKAKFKPHFIIQILIFIGVFLAIQVAMVIPLFVYGLVSIFKLSAGGMLLLEDPNSLTGLVFEFQNKMILPSLICTVLMTILTVIYCKAIEKRSLYSMGFVRKKAFSDYIIGGGIGLLMLSTALLIAFLCGTVTYEGYILGNGTGLLLLFLLGFIIQGMGEEVFLRGYFMVSVASRNSVLLAVISNSVLFALLHIFNNGIDVIPLINLMLFGIFASIYTLKTDSIWGICALHTTWNFAQGNIFGIKVSGIDTQVSLFSFKLKEAGALINGGAFGLEGGIAVTLVLIIGIFILLSIEGRGLNNESHIKIGDINEGENL